jgi:hypothetical protein
MPPFSSGRTRGALGSGRRGGLPDRGSGRVRVGSGGACPSAPPRCVCLKEKCRFLNMQSPRLPDSGVGGNRRLLCDAPRPKGRTRLIFGTNTPKTEINGTEDSGDQQQIELTHQRTHPPRRPPPRRSYVPKRRLVADPAGSPAAYRVCELPHTAREEGLALLITFPAAAAVKSRIQPKKKGATYEILHSPQKFKSAACFFPWH